MKKSILISALLMFSLSAALFVKLYDPVPVGNVNSIARDIPKVEASMPQTLVQPHEPASPGANGIDLDQKIEAIRTLSKKALRSEGEAEELRSLLSDRRLQERLFDTLSSGDRSSFNIESERDRMEMIGLLSLLVSQKNLDGRQLIINRAAERIISVNFNDMRDLKQKQSIFGDVVEMVKILKRLEPETYESVRATIFESQNKTLNHAIHVAG